MTRAQAEHEAESSVGHARQPTPSPYLGLERRGRLHTRQTPARTGRGSREGPGRITQTKKIKKTIRKIV